MVGTARFAESCRKLLGVAGRLLGGCWELVGVGGVGENCLEVLGVAGNCWKVLGAVGSCWEFVGSYW